MDDNLDVAHGLKDNLSKDRLEVDVKQFIDANPISQPTAFKKVKQYILSVQQMCQKGTYPFDVLCLDSLTALSVASQYEVMKNSGKAGDNPEIQHWGLLLTEIENVITYLRALPIPVIFICHELLLTAEESPNLKVEIGKNQGPSQISKVAIAIPGQKLPPKITRMFSEIWYMDIQNIGQGKSKILLRTLPTETITCRSGMGLKNGKKIGIITKDGASQDSTSMLDLLKLVGWQPDDATIGETTS